MLCVKTKVKSSSISGLGLFADQDIPKGTTVWKFEPKLDIGLSEDQVKQLLTEASKQQFHNYAFFDKARAQYILCGDDARFFNHSATPNCDDRLEDITIALRNIEKDEELTVNYKLFDGDINKHLKNH